MTVFVCGAVVVVTAATATAHIRAHSTTAVAFKTWVLPVTSSRGYRFVLRIRIRKPALIQKVPGYNVGETSVIVRPQTAQLAITNKTPGRPLDVAVGPHVIALRLWWKLPHLIYASGGVDSVHFARGLIQFGVRDGAIRIRPGQTMKLPLSPLYLKAGRGVTDARTRDVPLIVRALEKYPSLIEVDSDATDVLDGYWDACFSVNDNTIAAVTGAGKRIALNDQTCQLFDQK
jgi:hypothetical protein